MATTALSEHLVHSALTLAGRAPSVHNSQPWRWKLAPHSVHLFMDRSRLLPVLDPTGRELVISCGAALHHARIAFTAAGWRPHVRRFPNPAQPEHLAAVELTRMSELDTAAVAAAAVAARRHTDRRPFLPDPVPGELLALLQDAASGEGAVLTFALDDHPRRELMLAIEQAGAQQRARPEYQRELADWVGTHVAAVEGIPTQSVPATGEYPRGTPSRDFSLAVEGELPVPVLDDGAVLAVLATEGDSFDSWLGAGEALSAVLLTASGAGLATCPLSHVGETTAARTAVRENVLAHNGQPQMAIRIGWPATHEFPGPLTPRRPVADSIETFPG